MEDNKFEKLKVWKVSHELVLEIYKLTKSFPSEEKYSLVDQIKRSSSSIAANIVEGNERKTKKEFIQYLYQAKGSCAETKYHLLLSRDLGYINTENYQKLAGMTIEISKMLASLINYLKSDI
ncbi:four helix bundle protein [Candidatus Shapirobacteria bacterium CG2_30_35_20]|uniref:Four helix bundle protein n=1 Tax=Candidatus Shapirobacteria bacterium CG2_30_35_20 TaxID=1805376 RepID=A0A1J5I163_9BACT|nr:MAG: four helix bundle protein [Candidatus Shapirobacteria bacterium CG2_30_35_20]